MNGTYNDAPKWLAAPDRYACIKAFRGILPASRDVEDSTLLTQAAHDGPALEATPRPEREGPPVAAGRARSRQAAEHTPFVVESGANVIDLKDVDPALAGSTLEFVADVKGGVLTMTTLRLHAATTANVSVETPFFVQMPKGARVEIDPKNATLKADSRCLRGSARPSSAASSCCSTSPKTPA